MTTSASYPVRGMTCDHCVTAVTDEIGKLPGVRDVRVDLAAGGTSIVHVTSDGPLDDVLVRDAVDEAGYDVADGSDPAEPAP